MQIPQQSMCAEWQNQSMATLPSNSSGRNQANAKNDSNPHRHLRPQHNDCSNRHPLCQARHNPRPIPRHLHDPSGEPDWLRDPLDARLRRPLRPLLREDRQEMDQQPEGDHPTPEDGDRHDLPHFDNGGGFFDRVA